MHLELSSIKFVFEDRVFPFGSQVIKRIRFLLFTNIILLYGYFAASQKSVLINFVIVDACFLVCITSIVRIMSNASLLELKILLVRLSN